MRDYRELDVWNNARRLTLAAFQFTEARLVAENGGEIALQIQRHCLQVLTVIQQADRQVRKGSRRSIKDLMNDLGALLTDAHRQGIIGTLEFSLLIKEVVSVKGALTHHGAAVIC